MEFEILFTQHHTLNSIPYGSNKFDNHDGLGWPNELEGLEEPNDPV